MVFVYGFLVWFVCHHLLSYCAMTCYAYDCLRRGEYLIKFLIAGVLFTAIVLAIILLEVVEKYYIVLMVAVAIAICSSFISLEEKGEEYYKKQAKKGIGMARLRGGTLVHIFWIGWLLAVVTAVFIKYVF